MKETGQLVVRSVDGLMSVWFAGIGDPEDLFVELRPRDAWVDRDELVMGALCSLTDAERLLSCLYRGATTDELANAGWLCSWRAARHPEAAFVGEVDDGPGLADKIAPH
jgi:hypothetical protein